MMEQLQLREEKSKKTAVDNDERLVGNGGIVIVANGSNGHDGDHQ